MKPEVQKQFRVKQEQSERDEFDQKWDKLNAQLKGRINDYTQPNCPFVRDRLIRDFNPLYFKIYDKVKAVEL